MADDAIYRLAHRDAYNASFAARKTQKVNSVAAQAATPTRFLALKDDNAGALGNVRIGTLRAKSALPPMNGHSQIGWPRPKSAEL